MFYVKKRKLCACMKHFKCFLKNSLEFLLKIYSKNIFKKTVLVLLKGLEVRPYFILLFRVYNDFILLFRVL